MQVFYLKEKMLEGMVICIQNGGTVAKDSVSLIEIYGFTRDTDFSSEDGPLMQR
ncbi:MAG: hypothetical protein JSC085_000607 [Candidatus Tokpelaia sp. JSC085]|nr:MAG: hypothetical protein JSC085_000607 [Candidatus Tokpelaia sp. JSC085]